MGLQVKYGKKPTLFIPQKNEYIDPPIYAVNVIPPNNNELFRADCIDWCSGDNIKGKWWVGDYMVQSILPPGGNWFHGPIYLPFIFEFKEDAALFKLFFS